MVPSCVHGPHKGTAGLGSSLQPFQHNPLFFCKVRIGQWQQNWCCSLMLHSVVFLTTYSLAARTGINLFSTTSKLLITEVCELFACDKKNMRKANMAAPESILGEGMQQWECAVCNDSSSLLLSVKPVCILTCQCLLRIFPQHGNTMRASQCPSFHPGGKKTSKDVPKPRSPGNFGSTAAACYAWSWPGPNVLVQR